MAKNGGAPKGFLGYAGGFAGFIEDMDIPTDAVHTHTHTHEYKPPTF
jgi:hypothetical protein